MNKSYKRLVFNFYGTENFEDSISNKVHFNCLNHYSQIFDETIICISVSEPQNLDLIQQIKEKFIGIIKSKIITFKIVPNSIFGESNTFNEEIVKKLSKLDGITFFAHNKGLTNIDNPICDNNSVLRWICGSYFYNLEFIEEVEYCLIHQLKPLFYGSYLTLDEGILNKQHVWYAGTFYWLNAAKIDKYCNSTGITMPLMSDRYFDELFPGNIIGWEEGFGLASHNSKIIYMKNLYVNSKGSTDFLGNESENEKFNNFFSKMKEGVRIYDYTILTYNFGDYDLLREIDNPQENVEYICVTDRTDISSKSWNLYYDASLNGLSPMEKVYQVRYNCFKYCSTNLCVKIDSSIQILNSIDSLVTDFERNDKRIAVLVHPRSKTIEEEYHTWITERNLPLIEKETLYNYVKENDFNIDFNGLYEVGFMIVKKDYDTLKLNEKMLGGISYFKDKMGGMRVDQVLFSVIINNCFSYLNAMPLSHSIIQSDKLRWMIHGSDKFICIIPVTEDKGYLFNNLVELYNWK